MSLVGCHHEWIRSTVARRRSHSLTPVIFAHSWPCLRPPELEREALVGTRRELASVKQRVEVMRSRQAVESRSCWCEEEGSWKVQARPRSGRQLAGSNDHHGKGSEHSPESWTDTPTSPHVPFLTMSTLQPAIIFGLRRGAEGGLLCDAAGHTYMAKLASGSPPMLMPTTASLAHPSCSKIRNGRQAWR
jgi:hypothetical protein